MSRNNDYKIENLLYYLYHQKYHKTVAIEISRQKNTSIARQINLKRNLEKDNGATKFCFSM